MIFRGLAVFCGLVCCWAKIFTEQKQPIITGLYPHFGGNEGGTELTISGANFDSESLFTGTVVYIGNEKCEVIGHYSGDSKIVCITPKCYTESCLQRYPWSGSSYMAVNIYVTTAEGTLTNDDSYEFQYNNWWTPKVFELQVI